MKKFMTALLITAMIGSLAACGSSDDSAEATTEAAEEYTYNEIELDAAKYVELGEYKGLTIDSTVEEVTDEDIDAEIEDIQYQYADYEKVEDRDTVEDEDMVNVDYVCTVDGDTYEDLTESDMDVTLGSGELYFSEDLDVESALVGAKVGDTVTVKGKFSEDDDTFDDLAGKEATFEVTINFIEKEVYPEFNDAFVKENFDYDTVEEYREALREELEENAETNADDENEYALWELVVANSKQIADFPEDAIAMEKENVMNSTLEEASYYGVELGETEEEIDEFFQENYDTTLDEYVQDDLLRECVFDLLVEKEGIEVSEDEIDELIQEEMEYGGYDSEEEVLEYTSRDDFKEQILYDKVMDVIVDNAKINTK